MRSVVIAMPRIPHYRVPLIERLRCDLAQRDIKLRAVHPEPPPGGSRLEQDYMQLGWVESLRTRRVPGLRGRVLWFPLSALSRADLVVLPEAAGWLPTYPLLALRRHCGYRVACWGHGPGTDDHAPYWLTRLVRSGLARRFDWWFSYTDGTTRRLMSAGVPQERITTVYNTVDVGTLRNQLEITRRSLPETRASLMLEGPTAIYIGALRPSKRIDVLLDAGARVANRIDGFTLIIAGDGPERYLVENTLARAPWLRYVGPAVGMKKARLLAAADLMLQPAWLGLVVLDAFAAGLPIVTFDRADHSPEEEYLRNGVEGVRVHGEDPADLAAAVVELLDDAVKRKALSEGALRAGLEHSIEEMAGRFVLGIERALD